MSQVLNRITAPPEARQASTVRLPAFVDRIDDVSALFGDDYRIALANCAGDSMSICIDGDVLRVFDKFRAALRERGVQFADHGRYSGRRGADWWQSDVFNLVPELFLPDGEIRA